MRLLILGSAGFIGHHLSSSLLKDQRFNNWNIQGVDTNYLRNHMIPYNENFTFHLLDIIKRRDKVDELIENSDIVMPLVAIATPKVYVERPMDVFELDFEENLRIIKLCHRLNKRIIFPSTSEVYGKGKAPFDEYETDLVYGPIKYSRWIYACSKQLLDRVVFALDQKLSFNFTLFRPFNWVGPYLDSLESSSEGSSRLITQLINDALLKKEITLVDGGHQKRCFTDVRDGIDALKLILLNKDISNKKIYNIGNPWNELSVREVSDKLIKLLYQRKQDKGIIQVKVKSSSEFYGIGYQDVSNRIPSINNIGNDLGWSPKYTFDESLVNILDNI